MQRPSRSAPNDDGRDILIHYYDGAYGKTLRIDIQSLESLGSFVGLLKDLSTGVEAEASLKSLQEVLLLPPLLDVRLNVSAAESINLTKPGNGILITWSGPQGHWEDASELLAPLTYPNNQGKGQHQYLTSSDANVLVEVAVLE